MFRLEIETKNHAFYNHACKGGCDPRPEVARLLRLAANQVETGGTKDTGTLIDVNDNRVGTWSLTP